ncbi:MAG: putative lyase [Verrucomicrobiales bacterium]|nr:putative lyase [Verrucomicrobiales bacterium]
MPSPADWKNGTPLNMKEAKRMTTGRFAGKAEHKYDYSAIQFEIPAFGWASSEKQVGLWMVNPSIEYLSGGATKVELAGHLDVSEGAAPTLLNYWRGSHYGGSVCEIAAGEEWTKVIGPFLIYCNSGSDGEGLWKNGPQQATNEKKSWPYDWVQGVDFPSASKRGTIRGRIVIHDDTPLGFTNLLVGVTHPDYKASERGGPGLVDWQQDAKYYEFWTKGDSEGRFEIPQVHPGKYTLHAIADGVLGELTITDVAVNPSQVTDLHSLQWKPVRHGKQLWEIGVANRSAEEFFRGNDYWHWGLYLEYPKDFPKDVHYTIGKSDYRKDWNFTQCPRPDRPVGTPWTIEFNLQESSEGHAILRVGLASSSARKIDVAVNGNPAGTIANLTDTATIRRDGIRGYWREREVAFPANLLVKGTNTMTLTIPSGNAMSGVQYDYLRLEIDQQK